MASEAWRCERLEWDTNHFGVAIAQLYAEQVPAESVEWADENRIQCLYWLAGVDADFESASLLGFVEMDRRITLRRQGTSEPDGTDLRIRPYCPGDLAPLERIAAVSHRDSRFYRDGRFDRGKCDEMYRIWLRRSCEGWASEVLVAEWEGAAVGYCSWHNEGDGTGRIGLIAVDPAARGRGLGRGLTEAALASCHRSGLGSVSVRTQGLNQSALKLYEACGFRQELTQVWLHRWNERKH